MKPLLLSITLLFAMHVQKSFAQAPNAAETIKQEMKKIAYLEGQWKGEAVMKRGNTPPVKVLQEENVQFKLNGTILLVEGVGRSIESQNTIAFNALGIISYNPYTKQFAMKSHTMEGNQTEAYFKVLEENHFEWGFETPQKAKIKYDIVLNPTSKTWTEKGEYSQDGTTWYPFITLTLNKIN